MDQSPTPDPGLKSGPPSQPDAFETSQTPLRWRLMILAGIGVTLLAAWVGREQTGTRGQAVAGVVCFFGCVALFSANLRAVNWRTVGWGFGLQLLLALLVLKGQVTVGDRTWSVKQGLEAVGNSVKAFIGFSDKGAEFVFGNIANPADMAKVFGSSFLFPFAFKALPSILFVSAFFTVLYHFGILQWCVRLMARVMTHLMRTSGAETLSVSANVFMGQTEAPLIVKPYVSRMTQSELFTLMVSGFAHISGGMMIVYINYGADPTAVLTTCVMACPCSLYLSKLCLPELTITETCVQAHMPHDKSPYANALHAIVGGTGDGLRLVLNVVAMLIVFIAFVAMFDALLGTIKPMLLGLGIPATSLSFWPDDLSLRLVFGWLFAIPAFLMGIEANDIQTVGGLLGSKLAINEHFAYLQYKGMEAANPTFLSERSKILTAFALTGFANFASVGIQIGGISAIAPNRDRDLARLGGWALYVGFVATLLNAAIAGVFI